MDSDAPSIVGHRAGISVEAGGTARSIRANLALRNHDALQYGSEPKGVRSAMGEGQIELSDRKVVQRVSAVGVGDRPQVGAEQGDRGAAERSVGGAIEYLARERATARR